MKTQPGRDFDGPAKGSGSGPDRPTREPGTPPPIDAAAPGLGWIDRAAHLVPLRDRGAWRREWEAEVVFRWRRMQETGRTGRLARLRLRWRVFSCVIDAISVRWMTMRTDGWWNDVKFAFRGLMRAPGFTVVALVTLALGIGANTGVFSLVDGVLLRPLPFQDAEALVEIGHRVDDSDPMGTSQGLYQVYVEHSRSFESVALYSRSAANLLAGGEPERVEGARVTPSFFDVLGALPALGRTFLEAEGLPDGDAVVVLSETVWRTRYDASPGVIGATVVLDGVSRRVVGVMGAGFSWPGEDTRFWIPMTIDPAGGPLGDFSPDAVARLSADATLESARTETAGLVARLSTYREGAAFLADAGLAARVRPLKEAVVGDVQRALWVLMGTVGFVLLIAGANVTNLLLVRAEERSGEVAVRVAMGAGRLQIWRTFFAESLVLATGGALLGLLIARAGIGWAVWAAPASLPRISEVGLDTRAVGVALLLALGSAVLFGLFPALRVGSGLSDKLRSGGARGGTGGRERQRLRGALVIVQVALALILLVGSTLMIQSVRAMRSVDPGFDADGVVAVRLTVPAGEIGDARETSELQRQLVERARALPGVESAGIIDALPLSSGSFFGVEVEDHPRGSDDLPIMSHVRRASAGYFEAMGIPIVAGRSLRPDDDATGLRGVVVSRSFAERWWPGEAALGRRVRTGFDAGEWYEVVGVTGDVHLQGLTENAEEAIYFPSLFGGAERPLVVRSFELVVRTSGDPLALVPLLRDEARALHGNLPLARARSMTQVLSDSMSATSFTTAVLVAASSIALLLGIVGIYGVLSYVVSRRSREIGIRLALGAQTVKVRRMVVRQGLELALWGVGTGLAGAFLLSSLMSTLLFGVQATDPMTYAGVAATLIGVAVLACWVPAARAAGVQPSRALRAE